jgi:uncharacterized membrane protein
MAHTWLFGTVLFGLAASLSWGTGDFSGGLASRRTHVFSVVLAADAVGLVLLPALALVWSEPLPSWRDALWGASAGLAGTLGLTAYYRALAVGRMGINAPITAVLAAALPIIFSAFTHSSSPYTPVAWTLPPSSPPSTPPSPSYSPPSSSANEYHASRPPTSPSPLPQSCSSPPDAKTDNRCTTSNRGPIVYSPTSTIQRRSQ